AEALAEPGRFVEAIAAPEFTSAALHVLTTKPKWKANVRLLAVGPADQRPGGREFRCLEGGLLVQEIDAKADPESEWKVVTKVSPNEDQLDDLRFAWTIVRHVKSNAIVLVKDRALVGVGAGQMSRVDSTRIALEKAGAHAHGSVIGSDAFFPFPDSIEFAAEKGVVAAIQPGGSKQDESVIASSDVKKLAMIFTGRRHFKH
ncbi:MAG TPA: bifunctional phosphoribosylaminoimidazolecarboxamide formyltransferase/IMP cyclohydrolase, partial [Pirellulales bacterium]